MKWFKNPLQNGSSFSTSDSSRMHLMTPPPLICLSPKFKLSFSLPDSGNVTLHDGRPPHNSLLPPLYHDPWLTLWQRLQLMLCCWRLKSLPGILPSRRLPKSPCWVEPTAASSLTKVISRTDRVDDQARAHLAVSMDGLCRRSVAGGEPDSFLYSTHQPPLWLGWLRSARREVSLITHRDSWPKQEETSSSGPRAHNGANFPNWEREKKTVQKW